LMGAISENNGENPATVENWSNPVNRPQSMHVDANNNQRNTSTSDKCRQPPKLSPCKFLGKIEKTPKDRFNGIGKPNRGAVFSQSSNP